MNFSAFVNELDLNSLDEELSTKDREEMARMDEEYETIREIPTDELLNHLTQADRHALDIIRWDITDEEGIYHINPSDFIRRILLTVVILMRETLDATT